MRSSSEPNTPPSARPECPICRTLAGIGSHPWVVAELGETWVVLGDNQGCPGWCVLLLKEHHEHLAELPLGRQTRVFAEVARVAAAIRAVFPTGGRGGGPVRINYECLGNLVAHVHWHVVPRHADDPEPTKPVWAWPEERLKGAMSDDARRELVAKLKQALSGGADR